VRDASAALVRGEELVDHGRDVGGVLEEESVCGIGIDPDLRLRCQAGEQMADPRRDPAPCCGCARSSGS
jgi:hypothetical protein